MPREMMSNFRQRYWGNQCHLAADVLAHNSFVPRMLLLTSSTKALGHSYWEHRMDADVGAAYSHLARWIVTQFDHSHTDALFRRILSSTLFTFSTNRRIFRGMIRINGNESWQAIFDTVVGQLPVGSGPHNRGPVPAPHIRVGRRLPHPGNGGASRRP